MFEHNNGFFSEFFEHFNLILSKSIFSWIRIKFKWIWRLKVIQEKVGMVLLYKKMIWMSRRSCRWKVAGIDSVTWPNEWGGLLISLSRRMNGVEETVSSVCTAGLNETLFLFFLPEETVDKRWSHVPPCCADYGSRFKEIYF